MKLRKILYEIIYPVLLTVFAVLGLLFLLSLRQIFPTDLRDRINTQYIDCMHRAERINQQALSQKYYISDITGLYNMCEEHREAQIKELINSQGTQGK
jgi:hypothetical protein